MSHPATIWFDHNRINSLVINISLFLMYIAIFISSNALDGVYISESVICKSYDLKHAQHK